MSDGFRRFAILLGVFVFAFLAVFVFRKVQGGEGFLDLFKFGKKERSETFIPESYTLSSKPALPPGEVEFLAALDEEFAKLTEAVVPSVVSLHTEGIKRQLMQDWFGRVWIDEGYPVRGIGSGVIVSEEGHVVTNEHVTNGKSKISVTMHDGKTYPAIVIGEDRALDIIIGEGPSARSVRIDLPPFTLIGATTRQGLLTTPLRERFGIPLRLEFYDVDDLVQIVRRGAGVLDVNVTTDGATEIAARSRGTRARLTQRLSSWATTRGRAPRGRNSPEAAHGSARHAHRPPRSASA